jgi:hypothetical protein
VINSGVVSREMLNLKSFSELFPHPSVDEDTISETSENESTITKCCHAKKGNKILKNVFILYPCRDIKRNTGTKSRAVHM